MPPADAGRQERYAFLTTLRQALNSYRSMWHGNGRDI